MTAQAITIEVTPKGDATTHEEALAEFDAAYDAAVAGLESDGFEYWFTDYNKAYYRKGEQQAVIVS